MSRGRLLALTGPFAAMEGYDLACYGATVPVLLSDRAIDADVSSAGVVGALVAFGMLFGAAVAAALSHRVGNLRLLLGGSGLFSLGMLVCSIAPTFTLFGIARLGTGLGLGIVLPAVTAYVADHSEPHRRSGNVGIMTSGYVLGAMLAPLLSAALLPDASWRWIYVIGALPAFVIIPLAARSLVDRPAHAAEDTVRTAETSDRDLFGLRPLLGPGSRVATFLFWTISFCGLMLVFGLSNWLPTMLRDSGYTLQSSLLQTAVMWVGAGVGMIAGGRIGDRVGIKPVVAAAFAVGAASLVLMSVRPATGLLFLLMFVAGLGFIGSQGLTNAFVVTRFTGALRSRAIGWALAVGRLGAILGPLVGGLILSTELGVRFGFFAFAVPGVLGAVLALLVPGMRRAPAPQERALQKSPGAAA
ncbi:aromatic acid/H+ symport family MFS transporter [Thermocatellispora tengchongensis]